MNNLSLENLSINISKSWIISCAILTGGIMTSAYLNSLILLQQTHMKRKFKLELQQIEKVMDLREKNINNEDKIISYYGNCYNILFVTCISGLTIIIAKTISKK